MGAKIRFYSSKITPKKMYDMGGFFRGAKQCKIWGANGGNEE